MALGLKRARQHLAEGWHPCLTLDSQGVICHCEADEARRWCLDDALALHLDVEGQMAAWELLSSLACPGWKTTLWDWLMAPGRTQREVLDLMDRAAVRATRLEAT